MASTRDLRPNKYPIIAVKECRFAKFQDLYSLRNFPQMKVYRNVGYVVEENSIFAIFTFYGNYASQTRQPQRIILPTQGLMWPILPIFKLVFGFQYICKNALALGSSMNFYPCPNFITSAVVVNLFNSEKKQFSPTFHLQFLFFSFYQDYHLEFMAILQVEQFFENYDGFFLNFSFSLPHSTSLPFHYFSHFDDF